MLLYDLDFEVNEYWFQKEEVNEYIVVFTHVQCKFDVALGQSCIFLHNVKLEELNQSQIGWYMKFTFTATTTFQYSTRASSTNSSRQLHTHHHNCYCNSGVVLYNVYSTE
jgi:hypothetical protein